jgi:hypothetical protein
MKGNFAVKGLTGGLREHFAISAGKEKADFKV